MLTFLLNPLRRKRSRSAKSKGQNLCGIPTRISDQMAQDIGMSPSDLARHRFQWPSQSKDRPLI